MNEPISPDFPKNTPAQKQAWAKYESNLKAYEKYVASNTNRALKDEGTAAKKMANKKPTYWQKEEATRSKMDYRNAGFSPAEKKAMVARKLAEAKKKNAKASSRLIPASPTH